MNKRIGPYRVKSVIKETEAACIYRAVKCEKDDKQDGLFFAIKEYVNSILEESLEREERISLEIKNNTSKSIVIPIVDILKESGKKYAVMLFEGNGMFLSEIISFFGTKNVPLNMQLCIIEEILDALNVLHSFDKRSGISGGYLHLDLHPGNIFFESADIEHGEVGKVKFIDFANAVHIVNGEIADEQIKIKGFTQGYSSPECQSGEINKFMPAADLFSVGAIFYRMLIGKELDEGMNYEENVSIYLKRNSENPVIPFAISTFLRCSLDYNPKYRYDSAESMLKAVMKLKQLNNAYQNKDYYSLFSSAYDYMIPENAIQLDNTKYLEEDLKHSAEQLEKALKQSAIEVHRCLYIFQELWKMVNQSAERVADNIRSKLIYSGIACSNHTGNGKMALELYEELLKIKSGIPVLEYLAVLNRVAVLCADRYQYQKAYDIVADNIKYFKLIKKAYAEVACSIELKSEDSIRLKDLARAYSACGQYLTLLKFGNPMEMFEKALSEFGHDDSGNRAITVSHILSYAIETENQALYEQYGANFFKGQNQIGDQIDVLLKADQIDLYCLYVLLKGIYKFYLKSVDDSIKEKVRAMIHEKKLLEASFHPAQLIYRYIAQILYETGDLFSADVETALRHSLACIDNTKINLDRDLNILVCINYQTTAIYNELAGQDEKNDKLKEQLKEHCNNSGWKELTEVLPGKKISQLLSYEYA